MGNRRDGVLLSVESGAHRTGPSEGNGVRQSGRPLGHLLIVACMLFVATTVGACLKSSHSDGIHDDDLAQPGTDSSTLADGRSVDSVGEWDAQDSSDAVDRETSAADAEVSTDALGPDVQVQCTGNLQCDDGIDCTQDLCTPQGLCSNQPSHTLCQSPNPCVLSTCVPGVGCQQQDLTGPCDDGDPCTADDVCVAQVCQGTPAWTAECHYDQAPNLAACEPGSLSEATKTQALLLVNDIRQLSGLPSVPYLNAGDQQTQAAALMMAANAALNHTPPASWKCFTQEGYDGASSSNLHYFGSSAPDGPFHPIESILGFLIDDGVPSLGHRRWLLDPFLPGISYGSVHGTTLVSSDYPYVATAALKVIYTYDADIGSSELEYVAYPFHDYPSDYFQSNWYLSFSALVDPTNRWNNANVSYANATVAVTGPNDAPMTVSDIQWDNDAMGIPNHIQWKVANLKNLETYVVRITNVKNGSQSMNFEYWFRLE